MDGSRESGLWVPASTHAGHEYDDEEEEEELASINNGEGRGREERVETI